MPRPAARADALMEMPEKTVIETGGIPVSCRSRSGHDEQTHASR